MSPSNIKQVSKKVFELDEIDLLILKKVAYSGGTNLNSITKYIANRGKIVNENVKSFNEKEITNLRRKIIKRIQGKSQKITGLILNEYLVERIEDKHRWKQQERTYFLTPKGLLASLSTGISPNKIKFLIDYFDFLANIIPTKKATNAVKNFIQNEMHVFLLWNAINGLQLKNLKGSVEYYRNVIDDHFSETNYIELPTINKNELEKIHKVFIKYFASRIIISHLYKKEQIPHPSSFLKWKEVEDDFKIGTLPPEYRNLSQLDELIRNWVEAVTHIQKANYDLDKSLQDYYYPISNFKTEEEYENYQVESKKESDKYESDLKQEIRKQLKKLKYKIKNEELTFTS